jgi:hypothetical protein
VLPLAARIGEAQVDVLDVVVLDRFEDVFGGLHEFPLSLAVGFLVNGERSQTKSGCPSSPLFYYFAAIFG